MKMLTQQADNVGNEAYAAALRSRSDRRLWPNRDTKLFAIVSAALGDQECKLQQKFHLIKLRLRHGAMRGIFRQFAEPLLSAVWLAADSGYCVKSHPFG